MVWIFLGDLGSVTRTVGPVANQPETPPPLAPAPSVWSLITSPQLWAANAGNGQPPRPGVFGTAQAYTGQIAPNQATGTPIDLTPFMDILENGIRNEADLKLAHQLFMLIDPEDAGKISEAAKGVPIKFVEVDPRSNIRGGTHVTFDQDISRKTAAQAQRITLHTSGTQGTNIVTLLHERVHAAPYSYLPLDYHLDLPDIPGSDATFHQIYHAVLANKYYDEAMAFSSETRFAMAFHQTAGHNLFEFKSLQNYLETEEVIDSAYAHYGFEGVYWAIRESEAYLPYKIGALYLALLRKTNQQSYPTWGEILTLMNVEEKDGKLIITAKALGDFYQKHLKPLIDRHQTRMGLAALSLATMTGEAAKKRDRALAFLMGRLSPEEAQDFLRKDFDFVVTQVGALMGDPLEEKARASKQAKITEVDIEPRPKPLPANNPNLLQDAPEMAADTIEILGKEAELVTKILASSIQGIISQWKIVLHFAEYTDPLTAAKVYGKLMGIMQTEPKSNTQWQLGISLLRSGYMAEGMSMIAEAFREKPLKSHRDSRIHITEGDIKILVDAGEAAWVGDVLAIAEKTLRDLEQKRELDYSLAEVVYDLGIVLGDLQALPHSTETESLKKRAYDLLARSVDLLQGTFIGRVKDTIKYSPTENETVEQASQRNILFQLGRCIRFYLADPQQVSRGLEIFFYHDQHFKILEPYNRNGLFTDILIIDVGKCGSNTDRQRLWDFYFRSYATPLSQHLEYLADLALGSTDLDLQRAGLEFLLKPQTGFTEIARWNAILKNLASFPSNDQASILKNVYQQILSTKSSFEDSFGAKTCLFKLIKLALEGGQREMIQDFVDRWKRESTPFHREKTIGLWVETLSAILNQGQGLDTLVERIEHDLVETRRQFDKTALLEILSLLSEASSNGSWLANFAGKESCLLRLAMACIDKTLQSIGGHSTDYAYQLSPLFDALKTLPVSDQEKDKLFAHLIEKASPEPGVYAKSLEGLEGLLEAIRVIPFILESPNYPLARKILINRLAAAARALRYHGEDFRMTRTLEGLQWVCERLTDDALAPSNPDLKNLRTTDEYQRALAYLRAFVSPEVRPSLNPGELKAAYQAALREGDTATLQGLSADIKELVAHECQTFRGEGYDGKPKTIDELRQLFFAQIYEDWQRAYATGEEAMAETLFELWSSSNDPREAKVKRLFFLRELANPSLSLKWKRLIFAKLKETDTISVYAVHTAETLSKNGETEQENLFYQMFELLKSRDLRNGGDFWLNLIALLPPDEARQFLQRCRLQVHHSTTKFDLAKPMDWLVYMGESDYTDKRTLERRSSILFAALHLAVVIEKKGITHLNREKLLAEFLALVPTFPWQYRYLSQHDFGEVLELLQRAKLPTAEVAEALIAHFPKIQTEYDWLYDKIRLGQVKLPPFFEERDILTRHLLTWIFLEFIEGEQNPLLVELKNAKNFGEALRIFIEKTGLEKVGQFLSFWPEVPLEIRQELVKLQSNVEPSHFEEVKATIREQFAGSPFVDELITNLETYHEAGTALIGSGTIGEVYRSALTIDGRRQEVAIKVVPKSKEDKFKTALSKLQNVARFLELHSGRLPGAQQAKRLVNFFLEMVRPEFDLTQEAQNAAAIRAHKSSGIDLPEYVIDGEGKPLVRAKASVQKFIQGIPLSQIPDHATRQLILDKLQEELMKQALEQGRYHSDLQPGNVRVQIEDDGTYKIWLLDFGQVGELSGFEQNQVREFMGSFMELNEHPDQLVNVLEQMGTKLADYDRTLLLGELIEIGTSWEADLNHLSELISRIFKACQQHGLEINLPYLQLLKGMATFEALRSTAMEAPDQPARIPVTELRPMEEPTKPDPAKPEIPKPTFPPKPDSPWLTALKGFWKEHVTTYGERALAEKARIVEALNQHFAGELSPEEINKLFDRLYDPMGKAFTVRSSSGEVFENLNHVEALLRTAVEQGKGNTVTIEDFLVQIEGRKDGTLGRFQEASFKEILKSPIWVEHPMGGATTFIIADILSEAAMGRWQHASPLHAGLTWAELAAVGGGSKKIFEASFEALETKLKAQMPIDRYKSFVGNKRYLAMKRGLINHSGTYLALAFMQMIATGEVSFKDLGKMGLIFTASHTVTAAVMKGLSLVLKGLKGTGLGTVVSTIIDFYVFKKIEASVSSIMLSLDMNKPIEAMETSVAKIRVNQDGEVDYEAFNKAFGDLVTLKTQDNAAALALQKYQTRLDEIAHHNIFLLHRLLYQPEVIRGQSELVAKRRALDPKLFKTHAFAIAHNRLTELPLELRNYVSAARTQGQKLTVAAIENDRELKSLETEFLDHCNELDPMTAIALREQLGALHTQAKTQALTKSWGLADQNIAGLLTEAALLANQKTAESERQTFMATYKQRYTDWDKKDLLIKTFWNSYPNDPYYGAHQQAENLQLASASPETAARELDLGWWKDLSLPDLYVLKDYVNESKATPPSTPGFEAMAAGIQVALIDMAPLD
ncbi:MAG: hypothetical protein HYU97_08530 [Deltaproteobacteria bacterium]|nr:hypothetical protein [Deltaproteobacteria bacterium]